jgi:UDP-glucose 4-epimerase
MRDFLYIEDLARLVDKVINKKEAIKKCTIFNAGLGKGIVLKKAIQKIFTLMNFNGSTEIRPYRNNEYFYQIADIQKAKKILNWKPEVLFDEGIKKTIAWIKRLED